MSIASRDKFDLDFSLIHEKVFPVDVRDHDRVVARVRRRGSVGEFVTMRVWKLSPLGVELVNTEQFRLAKSDKIDLELIVGGQRSDFEGLVVDLVRQNDRIDLAGIRLSEPTRTHPSEHDQRKSVRWICSEEFYPTCVSPTPGRFNEYMYFQIRDISREGFQLLCSLRNKYLIPGTLLNLTASFPMIGDASIPVKVTRIGISSERDKDYLVVGTEYVELAQSARSVIGQYLLQFSNAETVADLKDAGFFPSSLAKGTDFYFLKSEGDYQAVLELRLKAHKQSGTINDTLDLKDMSDLYDASSRIIVGKHRGRVVASARVRFNILEEPMEHESYIEWPQDLPRRDSIFEITRVCTDPDYRRQDLLSGLLRFIGTTCIQPQRPWCLISTTDALLPFYEKIGLVKTGLTYNHAVYRGTQNVMLTNALDVMRGKFAHPLYWNAIWSDVYTYLVDTGVIIPEPMDHARVKAYRLMGPLSLLLTRISRRPKTTQKAS